MSIRSDRRMAAAVLAGSVLVAAAIVAVTAGGLAAQGEPIEQADPITEPRVCAAAAVYHLATDNDWGLRAIVANAALNQYAAGGPDCRPALVNALTNDFSQHRWRLALEAVDAVASGSYAIPSPCIRANRVVSTPLGGGTVGPALHCSMGGLSFVQVAP